MKVKYAEISYQDIHRTQRNLFDELIHFVNHLNADNSKDTNYDNIFGYLIFDKNVSRY